MNPFLRGVLEKVLGTSLRHGVFLLSGWLVATGSGALSPTAQTSLVETIIGVIGGLLVLVWSYVRSHLKDKQVRQLSAIAASAGAFPMRQDDAVVKLPPPSSIPPAAMLLFVAFMSGAAVSCATTSGFDQNTYESAQSLKKTSLVLIQSSVDDASNHREAISALKVALSAQLAYEQGKGKANMISAKQWEILASPDRDLLGGLLKRWEDGKKSTPPYLIEKSQQISDAFDQVLKLEGAKPKN